MIKLSDHDQKVYKDFDQEVFNFVEKVVLKAKNRINVVYTKDEMVASVLVIEGQRAMIQSLLSGEPFNDGDELIADVRRMFNIYP